MASSRFFLTALPLAAVVLLCLTPLRVSAYGWPALTPKYSCTNYTAGTRYPLWFTNTCECKPIPLTRLGYSSSDSTCPGVFPKCFGSMCFGNRWLMSVGYKNWVDYLQQCARYPYVKCQVPGMQGFVGGGAAMPNTYNPEPPYSAAKPNPNK